MNLVPTITAKYSAHLRTLAASGQERLHVDAAILALRMALADLDEGWLDEYSALQQHTTRLQNELVSARELEQRLQAGLNQVMLENDVLEAESNRLRQHYADSERNYELSRQLAHEARTVRSMIRTYLLPHLVTPHGYLANAHLRVDHWAFYKRLLDNDGEPLDEPAISSNLIELAHEMFEHLKNQIAELLGQRDGLWHAYNELKTTTTASSSPTTASTASSALAAQPTSSTPDPTPSPQANQSSAASTPPPPAPASSATTSTPNRTRSPKTTPPPAPSGRLTLDNAEGGDTTSLDPTSPWLAAAAAIPVHDVEECIEALNAGQRQWRRCLRPMRLAVLAEMWQPEWEKQRQFDLSRPQWMPTAGALAFLSTSNRWSELTRSIVELRKHLSASSC